MDPWNGKGDTLPLPGLDEITWTKPGNVKDKIIDPNNTEPMKEGHYVLIWTFHPNAHPKHIREVDLSKRLDVRSPSIRYRYPPVSNQDTSKKETRVSLGQNLMPAPSLILYLHLERGDPQASQTSRWLVSDNGYPTRLPYAGNRLYGSGGGTYLSHWESESCKTSTAAGSQTSTDV